jgi:hypothetical protein
MTLLQRRRSDEASGRGRGTRDGDKRGRTKPRSGPRAATSAAAAKAAKGARSGRVSLPGGHTVDLIRLTATVGALLTATVVATAVILFTQLFSAERYDAKAAEEALQVAPGYVEQVISYDYRTLDTDVREARKNLTGKFLGEYDRSMRKVTPTLVSQQAIQEARTAKAGVEEATGDEVSVLVFSQRTTTKAGAQEPRVYQDRILVTLSRVGDRWLISQMRYLV